MTALDRLLQAWRIRKAAPHVGAGVRLLDVGACGGEVLRWARGVREYVGVEPRIDGDVRLGTNARIVKGVFPDAVPGEGAFDCITMLAVLEHIPAGAQPGVAAGCARLLRPGGRLVVTVPAAAVDRILAVLQWCRLVHGIALEEHYGYDVGGTVGLFEGAGLRLVRHERFQLGLNNLFVFERG